jgi:lipoprotein-releasing system permease protein
MLRLDVALAHLTTRKRQTFVSLSGVVLGVAFFLAVSSLMRGPRGLPQAPGRQQPHITVRTSTACHALCLRATLEERQCRSAT